eukprot:SM000387S14693  [mRNA]  locus=s387:17036:19619:- [translate_table: standard]
MAASLAWPPAAAAAISAAAPLGSRAEAEPRRGLCRRRPSGGNGCGGIGGGVLEAAPARNSKLIRRSPAAAAAARRVACSGAGGGGSEGAALPEALLFDCDGVLVDTERDGHRISFNDAFREKKLDVEWEVDLYGELLKIGGGKERMTAHFTKVGWPEQAPESEEERKAFIAELHKLKTGLFMNLVETGALPLRPGVARLVDEALGSQVKVAVCSTSNEKAVSAIVRVMLGPERAKAIQIFAGDVVPKKKPDPAIYQLAAETLGVSPARCVVVEDSHIGVTAAKAAGMTCIVTKSGYTADEDFSAADAVYDCIGDSPADGFSLATLVELLSAAKLPA